MRFRLKSIIEKFRNMYSGKPLYGGEIYRDKPATPICKHQNKEMIAVLRFSVNFIKKPVGKPDNPLWRDHEIPLFQCMDCFKFLYPEKPLNWFNISPVDPDYWKTK